MTGSGREDDRGREAPDEDASDAPIAPAEPSRAGRMASRTAWLVAGVVTFADAMAVGWAFRPENGGSPLLLAGLVVVYGLGAAICIRRLRAARSMDLLRPRAGDFSIGAVVSVVLYAGAMGVHMLLAAGHSPRVAWIIRVYLQRGDPRTDVGWLLGAAVALIAAAEELTWRGLVMRGLEDVVGPWRAVVVTAVLFTAAHLPTAWLLRDPDAGLNPLVLVAGLGSSLVFGWLVVRTRRLAPALFAHALFSWAIVEFPVWRPY